MTAIVQSSSPSSIQCGSPTPNDGLRQNLHLGNAHCNPAPSSLASVALHPLRPLDTDTEQEEGDSVRKRRVVGGGGEEEEEDQLSILTLFVTAFRKSVVRCYNKGEGEGSISTSWAKKMEIGLPTNVRHVAHVTFDRFNGFLGLPVEFEPEVPRRAPSASATVFGVSTNSMQLSFDSRGNSVPTILLMMQRRLYALGGLEVEGIFRINAGNDQEEYVKEQLNRGLVPDDADVHCLAGLIKAWFRELPTGLLDSFSPEELMQSQTEEECVQLARTLPLTEASVLDWVINLMADIAQYEHLNKMNPRNVAVVFAPNMTHVMDPLTALMHAVQVMNFLKTLIERTLREREDAMLDDPRPTNDPSNENGPQSPLQMIVEGNSEGSDISDDLTHKPSSDHPLTHLFIQDELSKEAVVEGEGPGFLNSIESMLCSDTNKPSSVNSEGSGLCDGLLASTGSDPKGNASSSKGVPNTRDHRKVTVGQLMNSGLDNGLRKDNDNGITSQPAEKNKGTNIISRINPLSERIEAWR